VIEHMAELTQRRVSLHNKSSCAYVHLALRVYAHKNHHQELSARVKHHLNLQLLVQRRRLGHCRISDRDAPHTLYTTGTTDPESGSS